MSDLIRFDFQQNQVRVATIDGEPWFLASDVCRILGLIDVSTAVSRLDDDERKLLKNNSLALDQGVINQALNKNQQINLINESGLYSLVFASRKPEAKIFKKWITSDLLPTIRKTGSYRLTPDSREADTLRDELQSIELAIAMARRCVRAAKHALSFVPVAARVAAEPIRRSGKPRYCCVTPALMAEIRASGEGCHVLAARYGIAAGVVAKIRRDHTLVYRPYNGRSVGPLPEATPTLPPPPQPWWPANARSH